MRLTILLVVATGLLVAVLLWGNLPDLAGGASSPDQSDGVGAESANETSTDSSADRDGGGTVSNIMDYGATGDGVTSDQVAWEAAVDATVAGGTLLLPPGRAFALPGAVTIDKPLKIAGDGATIVKPPNSPMVSAWFAVTADNVSLNGITFSDPNGRVDQRVVISRSGVEGLQVTRNTFAAGRPVAVRLEDNRDAVVEGNVIVGTREGITVSGPSAGVVIQGNEVKQWRNYGIRLVGTGLGAPSNVEITGNRVTDLAPGGHPRYPIHTERGKSKNALRDLRVVGNVVLGPAKSFTSNQGGTADQISMQAVDGLLVEGNVSRDGGDMGITVENCRDATVSGNVVTGSDVAGIAVFTDVIGATVKRNTILDNGQNRAGNRPPPSRAGIRLSTSATRGPRDVQVLDNVLGDTQASKTQLYGVSIGDSMNVVVGPNADAGNAVSLYLDEGSNSSLSIVDPPAKISSHAGR